MVFFGTVLINFITEFLYSKYYTFQEKYIFRFTKDYVKRCEAAKAAKRQRREVQPGL